MKFKNIIFQINENVAVINLNRPEKLNSFNRTMATEVQNALDDCAADKTVRAILLSGVGKGFCAGQDLDEAIDKNGPSIKEIVNTTYNPIIHKIRNIEKPVVCAVNGVAAGAGANIALACDITLAARSAYFVQSFSKIGLIPDSGGTFFLPRIVGLQRAAAMAMLGDKVSAVQAFEMGMIYKVCSDATIKAESMEIAKKLAEMPTKGLGLTKRGFNRAFYNTIDQQLEFELELQVEAGNSYDYNEGVKAFLEKRKPKFKGE